MKISPFRLALATERQRAADLERLVAVPHYREARPCAGCARRCPCARRSEVCACGCSSACPDAAQRLSSAPERFPIEPRVLPLVFELNSLRVVQPCWSCEGHGGPDDAPHKTPSVWFYSASVVYPRLLTEHVDGLWFARALGTRWRIAVCPHSADPGATTFALEPELGTPGPSLAGLQRDLEVVAADLASSLRRRAATLLARR